MRKNLEQMGHLWIPDPEATGVKENGPPPPPPRTPKKCGEPLFRLERWVDPWVLAYAAREINLDVYVAKFAGSKWVSCGAFPARPQPSKRVVALILYKDHYLTCVPPSKVPEGRRDGLQEAADSRRGAASCASRPVTRRKSRGGAVAGLMVRMRIHVQLRRRRLRS